MYMFSYLSDPILSYRLHLAAGLIQSEEEIVRIFDVGCGQAPLLPLLPSKYHYVGVDIDENIIRANRERWPMHEWFGGNVDTFPVPRNTDVGLVLAVPEQAIPEMSAMIHRLADRRVKLLIIESAAYLWNTICIKASIPQYKTIYEIEMSLSPGFSNTIDWKAFAEKWEHEPGMAARDRVFGAYRRC